MVHVQESFQNIVYSQGRASEMLNPIHVHLRPVKFRYGIPMCDSLFCCGR